MINKIFTLLILLFLANVALAQQHVCGVSHEDQTKMLEFVKEFNNSPQISTRSSEPIYIPIKVHMTANNDGTGRINATNVLTQLGVLMEDYKKIGMYLYLQDARPNYLDNTSIYNNPGNFSTTIIGQKDNDALNIFICENANPKEAPETGVVAGYYDPEGDYIIMRNQTVVAASPTLSHEMGHLFSLAHTFFGWEYIYDYYGWVDSQNNPTPWNVNQFGGMFNSVTVPGAGSLLAEVMNQSNCTESADLICDTPPDYNFGFGAGGCVWNNTLKDINGDVIDTQEDNFMSYFDCDYGVFTEGQRDVMYANFNSEARDHVRSNYFPDTTEIISNHVLTSPSEGEQLEYYNNVLLNWTAAEGASTYLVTLNSGTGERFEYFVEEAQLLLEELDPNGYYFWDVRPFNEGFMSTISKNSFFFTGSELNTSVDESDLIQDVVVFPNPARTGQEINVSVTMEKAMTVNTSIIDLTGKVVKSNVQTFEQGKNIIRMESILETGIYILKMDTEDGSIHKKIIVQ